MGSFYFGVSQEEIDAAFAEAGADVNKAARLITGLDPLTDEQRRVLYRASGNEGYREWFPMGSVGHIGFQIVGSRGTGNHGWHILVPATPECRRAVNRIRRDQWFQRWSECGITKEQTDRLFSLCRGHEPTMKYVANVWETLKHCPSMSDRDLRRLGFRPGHPHEGQAIYAVRVVLGANEHREVVESEYYPVEEENRPVKKRSSGPSL